MKTVYIAGPMRGKPQHNFPAFHAARDEWRKAGWNVISPADLDGFNEKCRFPDDYVYTSGDCRKYAKRDLNVILNLKAENGDAIALLPGWVLSKGTMAEIAVGKWVGLAFYDAITFEKL